MVSSVHLSNEQLIEIALSAANNLSIDPQYSSIEQICANALLEKVMSVPANTVGHVPRSCRPLWAQMLTTELGHANTNNIWGIIRLLMLAKATLRLPPQGTHKNRHRFSGKPLIESRLKRWRDEGPAPLWRDLTTQSSHMVLCQTPPAVSSSSKAKRALVEAQNGHYSKAIQALRSSGVASPDNQTALADLIRRHPKHSLPSHNITTIPPALKVDCHTTNGPP